MILMIGTRKAPDFRVLQIWEYFHIHDEISLGYPTLNRKLIYIIYILTFTYKTPVILMQYFSSSVVYMQYEVMLGIFQLWYLIGVQKHRILKLFGLSDQGCSANQCSFVSFLVVNHFSSILEFYYGKMGRGVTNIEKL